MPTSAKTTNVQDLGLGEVPKNAPLLIILVDDLDEYHKELKKLTDGLSFLPINFRVLITDKSPSKDYKVRNSYKVQKDEVKKFFTFAHMALFLSDKISKSFLKEAIESDVVPIVQEDVKYLMNYTGPSEKGSAFKFAELNSWSMYASVVRALENFGFPYDWKNIIRAAKEAL